MFQLFGLSAGKLDKANGLAGLDGLLKLFGLPGGKLAKAVGLNGFNG